MFTHHKKQGFTLIELIIVISIIAVLASIAFMSLSGETSQARDSKRVSDLKTFEDAIATSNGKNKAIPYSSLAQASITTNTGDLYPLRGASLVDITNSLFDSDVLPTVPRDPKGAKYLATFLSSTDYQLFATKENPDTKTPTAIVRGSFKEGAIIDILTADTDDAAAANVALTVANPSRFVVGDIIKIDSEYVVVTGINASTDTIYVYRNTNLPDGAGAITNSVKVHNKGASIKLYDAAPGTEGLLCLGTVTATSNGVADASTNAQDAAGTEITEGSPNTINVTPAASGASSWGNYCTTTTNLVSDDSTTLPYSVTAD